jgi:hypothetical protein
MRVAVVMVVAVGIGGNHPEMLYYNILGVHRAGFKDLPTAMAMAAVRSGNGSETAARNQTNCPAPEIARRADQAFENNWSTYSQLIR